MVVLVDSDVVCIEFLVHVALVRRRNIALDIVVLPLLGRVNLPGGGEAAGVLDGFVEAPPGCTSPTLPTILGSDRFMMYGVLALIPLGPGMSHLFLLLCHCFLATEPPLAAT